MSVFSLRAGLNALPQQRRGWPATDFDEGQVHLDLEMGALWHARGDQRGRVIICRRGVIWITQKRDAIDYVLQEGEVFVVTLPGLVLVQAMEPASVTVITPSLRARPYSGKYRTFR
jgi:hypothetical protein